MGNSFSRQILKWWGFHTIIQHTKPLPKKCVIPTAPHTSNWDFPIGLLLRSAIGEYIHFVGKDSLFRPPFGALFRKMGGYPVDRSKRNNFVDAVVDIFEREEVFRLCLAPEGTRHRVDQLKTGFYYIAKGAGVPIVMCRFNWGDGIIEFSEPFWPTDNADADMAFIEDYFTGIIGYRPERSFRYPAGRPLLPTKSGSAQSVRDGND